MGISLEQYRLRVGLYHGGGTGSASLSSTTPIGHGRLALICLLLLLLISGIEPNPGPQYTCKQCHSVSGSVEAHFNHQKEKHCNVSCLNEDCQFKTSNLALYSVHCSRNHASSSSNPYPDVMCPVPNCQIPQRRSMKEHLEEHLDINQSFQCPFGEACKAVFTKKLSFRTHLSQVHKPKTQPSRKASTPASASGTQEILLPPNEFPPNKIKYDVAKFYLALEGFKILPSSTVQFISEAVAFFSEMSHHCLRRALLTQLFNAGIKKEVIDVALRKTFCVDPIFNMHHKGHDPDQVSTIYFRSQQLQKYFAYVPSIEIQLPRVVGQKNRVTRYVPLRASLESVFQDSKVRREVLKSFTRGTDNASKGILEDFTDGSAFQEHLVEHGFHKCIHLIFFIDAFEFSPFGPAKGLYKTHGVYFTIGNISAEFRSKVENILLAALLLDENLKSTEEDHLSGVDKFEQSLGLLIKDLKDLKSNGIVIDGEMFPVCFLFCTGDNLGANQLGSFIQSFIGHCCRVCTISMKDFKDDPFQFRELRNPENYDQSVILAKEKWDDLKEKSISFQTKRRTIQAQQKAAGKEVLKPVSDSKVSKSALKKLQQINHMGVKPFPSVLNQIPGFHVAKNGLPSCLAHDIFEGVADVILAGILKHFIEEKKWFSLCTLNRRIKSFKYKGKDEADAPSKIKSLDSIKGSAVETWTLIRLLPFLIEDLVQDKEDKYWLLYLDLKSITEYVCAPKISKKQVAYLKPAINSFLSTLKSLLPECLTPKAHFLSHYPALILIYGPLIRLWTMRFESRHVFFKAVARASRSFKNFLLTLAKKYQFRFAYDHLSGFIPPDVIYEEGPTEVNIQEMPTEVQGKLKGRASPESQETKLKSVHEVVIKSVLFKNNQWMMLDKVDIVDLKAGQIMKILVYPNDNIHLVMRVYTAEKTPNGYYVINESHFSYEVIAVDQLPDFEPLPAYNLNGRLCISLKHSLLCMGL